MKAFFKPFSLVFLSAALLFSGCSNDDDTKKPAEPNGPGRMKLQFDNQFGDQPLTLNKMLQISGTDSVKITGLQYFISNVELARTDGGRYKQDSSYHLIKQLSNSTKNSFTLKNIPAGEYNKITFLVGVDEAHNKSHDTNKGDLSVHGPMSWFWNTSYVFLKADGFFHDAAGTNNESPFAYEIGKDVNSRWVTLTFLQPIKINNERSSEVHFMADVKKLFNGLDLKANPTIKGDTQDEADAAKIANNYAGMFSVLQAIEAN